MHKFDDEILREYDIRGIVGNNLDEKDAYFLGVALSNYSKTQDLTKRNNVVVVGYDGRVSSEKLSKDLCKGFNESGYKVINVGLCPTPLLYMINAEMKASIAVMVTGSHNPAKYNGFKMIVNGKSFFGDDIRNLNKYIFKNPKSTIEQNTKVINYYAEYKTRMLKEFPKDTKFNLVWDTGNGAAGSVLREIVEELRGNHKIINEEVDGNFPNHEPDPTVEKNLEMLKKEVIDGKYDGGVAFDGDGDRVGIIDSKGRVFWGDQMLCVLIRPVLKDNPGANILYDVKTSNILANEIKRLGGIGHMVATGHSIVKTEMIRKNALLAGEMSAHIFFSDTFYGHDDAIYVALRFLKAVYEENKSLDEIYDSLPKMVNTPEIRIELDNNKNNKFEIIKDLKNVIVEKKLQLSTIDGVRVTYDYGWWIVRASNTQNVLSLRIEASNYEKLDNIKNEVKGYLEKYNIDF